MQLHARGQAAQRRVLQQRGVSAASALRGPQTNSSTTHALKEQAVGRTSAVRTYTAFGAVVRTSQASLVSKPGAPASQRVSCALQLRCTLPAALTRAQANDRQAAGCAARRSRAAQRGPPSDVHVRHQARAHSHDDLRAHSSCSPQVRRKRSGFGGRSRLPKAATSAIERRCVVRRTNVHPRARYVVRCRSSRELLVTATSADTPFLVQTHTARCRLWTPTT